MDSRVTKIAGLLCLLTFASAQESTKPEVPDKIKAPAGQELALVAHATGFQIYTCQRATDGQPAWVLKAPEAELRDNTDQVIGRHYAGPAWKHNDGSEVTGKVLAKVDSPDADAIPWLLLTATSHSGTGMLAGVSSIQRIHTKGGQPSATQPCTSRNSAGSDPSSQVPQEAVGRLSSKGYEPNPKPIHYSIAWLRNRYKCRPKVRQALSDTGQCFSRARRISNRAHLRTR